MIVETGVGIAGADSYASVAAADAYFLSRGISEWSGDVAKKESALIRATDYIDTRWGSLSREKPRNDDQGLVWPRRCSGFPKMLARATFEYALITLNGAPLAPRPNMDASGVTTFVKKTKVGPLEKEYDVVGGNNNASVANLSRFQSYPIPDALMEAIVNGSGGNQREVYR